MIILLMSLVPFTLPRQDQDQERERPPKRERRPKMEFTPLRVEPRVEFWRPRIHGVVAPDKVKGLEEPGESTRVSLGDDLALDPAETVSLLEVELFGRVRCPPDPKSPKNSGPEWGGFRLSYWRHSWTGATVLRTDLSIDGQPFPGGTPADQTLTVTCAGLDGIGVYENDLVGVEAITGVRYFLAEYELESPAGDLEDAEGGLGINLGLGVSIRPTSWCFAAGRVSWSGLLGVPIHEATACAGMDLGPLRLEAGYRGFWADKHSSTQSLDLSLEGPYLGLEFRF